MRYPSFKWTFRQLQVLNKPSFLIICAFLLNIRYRCSAEDSIKEIALDFQVPSEIGISTTRNPASIVVCDIYLWDTMLKGGGKFDATDSKYNFDGNLCTHLALYYLRINSAFEITKDARFDEVRKLRDLKKKNSDLVILLEVSLVEEKRSALVNELVYSAESRQKFIMQTKATLRDLLLDGIIIDATFYLYAPSMFNIFLQELKEEFEKENLLVAVEIMLGYMEWFQAYPNIAENSRICDFVFLNTYYINYHNNAPPLARHKTPLYSKESNNENIHDNLKNLVSQWQISRKNLFLRIYFPGLALNLENGMENYPFGYNTKWNSKEIFGPWRHSKNWGYDEICAAALDVKENWKMFWDDFAKVPFLKSGRRWITFENSRSIAEKAKLVNSLGLGGIALWAVNFDDFLGGCSNVSYPLLKTVNYQLSSSISERESQLCSLYIVDDKNNVVNYKPVMSLNPHSLKMAEGDPAEINCTVEGSPPFELNWKKGFGDNKKTTLNNNGNVDINTLELKGDCGIKILISTLKLKRVELSDEYFCEVIYSNRSATKSPDFKFQMIEPVTTPKFLEGAPLREMDLEATSSSNTMWATITTSVLFPLMIFAIAVVALVIGLRRNRGLTNEEITEFMKGTIKECEEEQTPENPEKLPYDESCELTDGEYKIDPTKILGSGEFGVVYSGQVKDVNAAAKTTKPGADKQYLKSLLSELKILSHIGHHPHIVSLLGAVTVDLSKGILYIFIELCPLGNLQDFLRNSREGFGTSQEGVEEDAVTLTRLYKWSLQISLGLCHLSSKNVIHGDLATRNVLLYNMDTIKITDFGLSRKLYKYAIYAKESQELLPFPWMAIESLRDLIFSIQSDVWSFGVTVWEIFSLGETPYPGISWSPDFLEKLKQNMRLQKPEYATASLYDLLLECWNSNPYERPSPQKILESFSVIMSEHFNDVDLQNEEQKEKTHNKLGHIYLTTKQALELCC